MAQTLKVYNLRLDLFNVAIGRIGPAFRTDDQVDVALPFGVGRGRLPAAWVQIAKFFISALAT